MVRRKRPYVPKVRGCSECARRRISCDRTTPACKKCTAKGLSCSGFGPQIKFRDGFRQRKKRNTQEEARRIPKSDEHSRLHEATDTRSKKPRSPRPESFTKPREFSPIYPHWALSYVEFKKECLLNYFSMNIAPEMVPLDDQHNGWRHLVLPIACEEDMVMNAVMAASSFHLLGRKTNPLADPNALYFQTIHGLRKQQNLDQNSPKIQQSVILAILILLVAVMVNGCSDFTIVFAMLESALAAIGGEGRLENTEANRFLIRQIHKMRVYGAPFISQDAGAYALAFQAQQSFDCLQYSCRLHPDQAHQFELIGILRQQAYDIYLSRVFTEAATPSTGLIETFISNLERLAAEGSVGEHVLIWACFIAASESHLPNHRQYFEDYLKRQYCRNGFGNILKALDLLQRIWGLKTHENWTALLPEPQVFIM